MLKVVTKTVFAVEIVRISVGELERLVNAGLLVDPIENVPSHFSRTEKPRWAWLEHEARDVADLFFRTRCPTDDQLLELKARHQDIRNQLLKVLAKAA